MEVCAAREVTRLLSNPLASPISPFPHEVEAFSYSSNLVFDSSADHEIRKPPVARFAENICTIPHCSSCGMAAGQNSNQV
jgi:hypothetical protein